MKFQINYSNSAKIKDMLFDNEKELFIYNSDNKFYISNKREATLPSLILPKTTFLGSHTFLKRFDLKYPYIAGAMAKGISSVKMVEELSKIGCLANFGSAGLPNDKILENVDILKSRCKKFGINIINIPGNQQGELDLIKQLIKKGVDIISAGAYIRMTPGLVLFRVKGIKKDGLGKIIIPNKILAKISRIEVAKTFLSPPPKKIIKKLKENNLITDEEAQLSQLIPMSSDIIAEADSGGHTDKQPAISLFPEILFLKNSMQKKYPNIELCTGLAGGISNPYSALAAFSMEADFIVTGSINQSCIEAGTSDIVKEMLSKAKQSDFDITPSADTFEIGGKVQVLKKGNKFFTRSKFLEKIYNSYSSIEDISYDDIKYIENKILGKSFENQWEDTKDYFKKTNPAIIEASADNPKKKMALIFKSYLGQSSWWAINGDEKRVEDFQIWSGPSIAAFNSWVNGTYLEDPNNRKVADIAMNLIIGAIYLSRINLLNTLDFNLPLDLKRVEPKNFD